MQIVLDLAVPAGGRVRTTWRPARDAAGTAIAPRGWAWVQHGFSRRAANVAGIAELLGQHGIATVTPDLATVRPWRSIHDVTWLTSVTLTVARAVEGGLLAKRGLEFGGPWLGVGHSAGGAVVAHAAAVLLARTDPGAPSPTRVAGLPLLDPVDSVGHLFAAAEPALGDVPLQALACHPSRCNRGGALTDALARAGRPVIAYPDLNHADPERIAAGGVRPASRAAAIVCGPAGPGEQVQRMATDLLAAVDGQLAD